jgi:hypothetical protein
MDREPQQLAADDSEVSGLGPRLSSRARLRRLAISVAAVLLALLVVVAGLPTLRQDALALLIAPTPTPTLASLPGADTFYFLATPPWVTVLVDGRPLDRVPVADEPLVPLHLAPVQLPRGVHTFEWRGTPFLTQRCTLPVPLPFLYEPRGHACVFLPYLDSPPGYVVQQRESLATLPPAQQSALQAAMADGLVTASASAVIQPGEPYLAPGPPPSGSRVVVAHAPLRATLQYRLHVASTWTWSEPCAVSPDAQPCRFPGQDCRQLCTATPSMASITSGADRVAWMVGVPVQAAWELTTLGFTAVSSELQGPGPGALLALLRISWDGTNWHVTPLFGHAAGAPVTDDAICAPARDWLTSTNGPLPSPLVATGRPGVGVEYVAGPDPTDGCFVSVDSSALNFAPVPPLVQPATFLLRFGVLIALNAAAHQLAPQLPVAGAHERAIASRLQAQAIGGG